MKLKATKKEIRNSGCTVLKIGYCRAQFLLKYQQEFAYSAGSNGWSCDYYRINNIIISTGYSPIGKEVDYELIREYDDKARFITCDYSRTWEEQREAVNSLLDEFIEKAAA